jgi:two-component SAPR family response regulator
LAEAHLRIGNDATAMIFIDAATDVRNALGIGAAIALELRGLPFTLETISKLQMAAYSYHLLEDWRALKGNALNTVQIRSFGGAALTYNDQKVKLNAGLATSIEVITYLLKNPNCTLEQIISNVFSEKLPEAAKRYFHLIRTELKQNIPGLSLPFDDATRTYHVDLGELQLQWDLTEVTRAIGQNNSAGLKRALEWYKGDFLPSTESEWALEERATLEWNLLKFGLSILEETFEKRDFATCLQSAEQMLEFDKSNETVLDYLIRATFEVKGPKVGLRELERVKKRFLNEFGGVPEVLERLSLNYHKVS